MSLATSRKGGVPLRRGLGHPRAQFRPPAASMQPAPPRTICWILAGPRPQGLRCTQPPTGRRHLAGWGHSPEPRRRPARAWLGPPQTLARASPAAAARGRGRRPEAANRRRLPASAANPRCPALGGPDGNIPGGSLRLSRLFPNPPRGGLVDHPAPPKPRRAVLLQGCGGGSCDWAPANRRGERRQAANKKLGPLHRVLSAEC